MFRTVVMVGLSLVLSGMPAFAADAADESRPSTTDAPVPTRFTLPLTADVDTSLPPVQPDRSAKRPAGLLALYVAQAGLQAFDAYSTRQAIGRGAREANPLMRGAVGSPATLWGVKVVTAAVPMVLAENMWRRNNRKGAIVLMVISNSIAATVAANNARVLRRQR